MPGSKKIYKANFMAKKTQFEEKREASKLLIFNKNVDQTSNTC